MRLRNDHAQEVRRRLETNPLPMLQTFANVAQIQGAVAVIAGIAFGLTQVRQLRQQPRRTSRRESSSQRASTSTGGSVAIPSRSSATAANTTAIGNRSSSRAGRTWK